MDAGHCSSSNGGRSDPSPPAVRAQLRRQSWLLTACCVPLWRAIHAALPYGCLGRSIWRNTSGTHSELFCSVTGRHAPHPATARHLACFRAEHRLAGDLHGDIVSPGLVHCPSKYSTAAGTCPKSCLLQQLGIATGQRSSMFVPGE